MPAFTGNRLLAFARELQRASTFQELLEITRVEAMAVANYPHVWLFISDDEDVKECRLIDYAGSQRELAWEGAPVLQIDGAPWWEQTRDSDEPVVVEDARTDPRTNKAVVAAL